MKSLPEGSNIITSRLISEECNQDNITSIVVLEGVESIGPLPLVIVKI